MKAVFAAACAQTYVPHAIHGSERTWPETNCHVDLWVEVLAAHGVAPEAMLGFTLGQDFEGDQFTFFKVRQDDLETLYDIHVTELAIFDRLTGHVEEQIARGRLSLIEMDSFYLPNTHGAGYRQEHGKTTVAPNRLDIAGKRMEYFHSGGLHSLEGDDFDGIFQLNVPEDTLSFLPYTEFAKFPHEAASLSRQRNLAGELLPRHFARRPVANPIAAFAEVFPQQVEKLADRPFGFFHKYAFNTLRQFGANFELLATHLDWISPNGAYADESARALKIAEIAKSVQFLVARAVTRRKFDPLQSALDPAVEAWDALMTGLGEKIA